MSIISSTLSYLFPIQIVDMDKEASNRRGHTRLYGKDITASVNGTNFSVINWSQGGLLLQPVSNDAPNIDETVDFTLKLSHNDNVIQLSHAGKVIRNGDGGIAILMNPIESSTRNNFNRMIDAVLAESFVNSQVS